MSTPDEFRDEPPQKRGMSTTAKVLLVLGSIAGVCLLVCCGGVAFVGWKFQSIAKDAFSTDPALIKQRTEEIVRIDIPEGFTPAHAVKFEIVTFSMKQVVYLRNGNANSMLMIMETNQPMQGGSLRQQREQMRQAMRQQGQQPGQINDEINEESSDTRDFTINDETVPFQFIKGTAAGGGPPTRQVVGIFQARGRTVMLMVMVPESDYDDEAIVHMIESIRLPGDDPPESGSVLPDTKSASEETMPAEGTPDEAESSLESTL